MTGTYIAVIAFVIAMIYLGYRRFRMAQRISARSFLWGLQATLDGNSA